MVCSLAMFKIIVSALLVAAAVAADPPAPCCTPDQWEGRAGSITGTDRDGRSMILEVGSGIAYDYENKLLAYTAEYTIDNRKFQNKTIIDYRDTEKRIYMIDEITGACTIADIDGEMTQACVPENAKSKTDKPFYYGFGNNKLMAKAFAFSMEINKNGVEGGIQGNVAVTDIDCVPIAEVVYGKIDGTDMMTTIGFVDITPGIKDPSPFEPPTACSSPKAMKLKGAIKLSKMSFVGLPSPKF